MIAYKVLRKTACGKLVSFCPGDPRLVVSYLPSKWIESHIKGTPLYVFIDLEDARRFQDGYCPGTYTSQIWKVRTKGKFYTSMLFGHDCYNALLDCLKYKENKKRLPRNRNALLPIGSVMVKSVLLLEKVL